MIDAEKAAFTFEHYRIPVFTYNEPKNKETKLSIKFQPSGRYKESSNTYELKLQVIGVDEDDKETMVFQIVIVANFKFEGVEKLSDIPGYFYTNSIAIIYPYVRSFLSTLTLQANEGILILGIVNLTNLALPLKENTVLV